MNYLHYVRNACLSTIILLLPAGLLAQGIQITNGGKLVMNGPVKLVLRNAGFTNNGIFTPGEGTVLFTGNEVARITGSVTFPFYNIIISQSPGNAVDLWTDITVNGTITLNSGNLLLNNQTLYLGRSGSISGESDQSHITGDSAGRIFLSRNIQTPPSRLNPGNIGVELTSLVIPGLTVIERKHTSQTLPNGRQSIQRSFHIVSAVNAGLNLTLRFFYLDAELNGEDESGLIVWSTSETDITPIPEGKDSSDINSNWVLKTGIDHWGYFTLAGAAGAFLVYSDMLP